MECICACIALFVIWKVMSSGSKQSAAKVEVVAPPLRPRGPSLPVAKAPKVVPKPSHHSAYVCKACGAQNPGGPGVEGTCAFCGSIHKS